LDTDTPPPARWRWRRTHAARPRERGQILILTAISMTALIGMAGLSVDTSFMYDKRNRLSAATDAAAKTAALEVHRQGTSVPHATLLN
jgi:Flp pilus assembly protein TadG